MNSEHPEFTLTIRHTRITAAPQAPVLRFVEQIAGNALDLRPRQCGRGLFLQSAVDPEDRLAPRHEVDVRGTALACDAQHFGQAYRGQLGAHAASDATTRCTSSKLVSPASASPKACSSIGR